MKDSDKVYHKVLGGNDPPITNTIRDGAPLASEFALFDESFR